MFKSPEFNFSSDNDISFLYISNNRPYNINSYYIENNQNTNYTNIPQDIDFNFLNNKGSFLEMSSISNLEESFNDELNDKNINEIIYINQKKEKKDIFFKKEIKKKNLGRKKKYIIYKGTNGKSRNDLIITKIKRKFLQSLFDYINNKIISFYKNKHFLIKRINSPFIKGKTETEKNYLNKKIIEIFCEKLSGKYNLEKLENFSNKKIINEIIKKNEALELIDIFINKNLKDMYEIYISNNISDFCLKNDIEKLSKQNEYDINYLNKYETKAINFISIIQNKNARKIFKKIKKAKKK